MVSVLTRWFKDALSSPSGLDQVFGLRMGMGLDELSTLVALSPAPGVDDLYATLRLPHGWPEFEGYALQVSATQGLCKLVAETPVLFTDGRGKALRQRFDLLAARINRSGQMGRRYDVHHRHSAFEGSDNWMAALHWGQSALTEVWSGPGLVGLGPVHAVALRAKALSPESGSVELMVELKNFPAAVEDTKASGTVPGLRGHSAWGGLQAA